MFDIKEIEKAINVINQQKEHLKSIMNSLPPRAQGRTSHASDIKSLELAVEALEEKIKANTPPDFGESETMSLVGGIDMYRNGKRYKSDISPKGRKVRFLDKNGYDADKAHARKCLKKNDVLTVHEIYVYGNYSHVEFEEFRGKRFNTVMFEDVEE